MNAATTNNTTTTKSAISAVNVTKTYSNGVHALKGINLSVKEGDFFALLGANGAGKSTLIGILTDLVKKTSGTVEINGYNIDHQFSEAKYTVGMVPQEFNFNIFEKVEEIVITQAGYFGVPHRTAKKETEKVLKELDLWEKRTTPSRMLSGGMKRRLMIARALVHKPKLLILDEPTAGVDTELRYGMWEYLKQLNAAGVTILLTTHYIEEAEHLCKNVAIIHQGAIVKTGTVKELTNSLDQQTYTVKVSRLPEGIDEKGFLGSSNSGDGKGLRMVVADDSTLEIDLGKDQTMNDMVSLLGEQGIVVQDIQPKGNRLEQLYLRTLKNGGFDHNSPNKEEKS